MKLDKLFVMAGALSCALGMSGAALGAEEAIVRNGGFEAGGDGKVAGWREQGKYAFRAGEGVNGAARASAWNGAGPTGSGSAAPTRAA